MVGSHEVETQQSVDVYLSLPHTLYMYIANLSKTNYSCLLYTSDAADE